MTSHFSWVHLVTVTIAQCWSRLGVTAEWSHHSAPESQAMQLDVVLISHLLQPNLATETVPLAWERQVTAPLPPLLGSPASWHSFHGVTQLSPQPDAISSFQPNTSRQCTNLHLLTPGLISGWRPKDQAFNGVKKLVLTQWNPGAIPRCWRQPEDHSLCDAAHTWRAQPPVTWASSAWALHLRFRSGGLSHAGRRNMPEPSLTACSSRDAAQGDVLTKRWRQKSFSSCVPHAIAGAPLPAC